MGGYEGLREEDVAAGYEESNRRMDEITNKAKEEYLAAFKAKRSSKQRTEPKSSSILQSDDMDLSAVASADESSGDALAKFQPRKERRDTPGATDRTKSKKEDDHFTGFDGPVASQGATQRNPQLDTDGRSASSSRLPRPQSPNSISSIPAKRPSISNPGIEHRRMSLSGMKIPKKDPMLSARPSATPQGDQLKTVGEERPPQWYKRTPLPNTRNKKNGGVDVSLGALKNHISSCHQSLLANDRHKSSQDLASLRKKLHDVIFEEVTPSLLKLHQLLHNERGLPSVFDSEYNGGLRWPFDVKADAEELYIKWARRVFETDILRGIRFKKDGSGKNNASIAPEAKVDAKYFGNGNLLNGQWWPFQICTLRDGAHGSTQGGIFGSAEDGAYSCILAGGKNDLGEKYPNEDKGDEVHYCGTDSTDGKPTYNTSVMLASVNKRPVRLIRSSKLGGNFAPSVGFRYDGLYDVVSFENMDGDASKRQRHRFTLVRCKDQDPIRGGTGPEKRPTMQEEAEFEKVKKFGGTLEG